MSKMGQVHQEATEVAEEMMATVHHNPTRAIMGLENLVEIAKLRGESAERVYTLESAIQILRNGELSD